MSVAHGLQSSGNAAHYLCKISDGVSKVRTFGEEIIGYVLCDVASQQTPVPFLLSGHHARLQREARVQQQPRPNKTAKHQQGQVHTLHESKMTDNCFQKVAGSWDR